VDESVHRLVSRVVGEEAQRAWLEAKRLRMHDCFKGIDALPSDLARTAG